MLSLVVRLVADFSGLSLALYVIMLALVRCLTKNSMENYMVSELYKIRTKSSKPNTDDSKR